MADAKYRADPKIANVKPYINHIREEIDVEDKKMGTKKRSVLAKTVASIEHGDLVSVGIAYRHIPLEPSYSRRIGRDIAIGRAKFAMAQSLGLTKRKGRPSRYGTITTLSKEEFPEYARALGVHIPTDETETMWGAVVDEIAADVSE